MTRLSVVALAFAVACSALWAGDAEKTPSEATPTTGTTTAAASPVTKEQAKAAYARIKGLEGKWRGQSTKGWTDTGEYRTIAGGSAVMHLSFDAHPGQQMATFIHPDGDRLILTHYCMANNQPRLLLTGYEDDGATLTFTFLDGTNMTTRDVGHMDQCVYRFRDDGTFTTHWTWYQDGKEGWMEEIVQVRADDAETTAATSGGAASGEAGADAGKGNASASESKADANG